MDVEVVIARDLVVSFMNSSSSKSVTSCALEFCDFYPLVNINPIALSRYLGSFVDYSKSISIPFFLNDFLSFLDSGVYSHSSSIIGVSLDVHKKCLISYPISLVVDATSIDSEYIEKIGPFTVIPNRISLDDLSVKSVVVFDYGIDDCLEKEINSFGYDFEFIIDSYDKFIKSSDKKTQYRVTLPKLSINTTVLASGKKDALDKVLYDAWNEYKDKKFYKRRPVQFLPSTYDNMEILNSIVRSDSDEKFADASSWSGPDSQWTEGEPLSSKRDDYGRGFRDLPITSWLGRKVRFRSINESAVDNGGVVIYDKNDIIKVRRSNGSLVKLEKNDPNLFFTIDLI